MKKLITFLVGLLISVSMVQSQNFWDKYIVNENFDGWIAWPTGWSQAVTGGGNVTIGNNIRYWGSGTGSRGADMLFPFQRDSAVVYVNFDLMIERSTIGRHNAFGLFISGANSGTIGSATAFSDLIAGVYLAGSSNRFHVWNMDIRGPVPVERPDTIVPAFIAGSFARPGTTVQICDSINLSTRTNVEFGRNIWYNLTFKLNFNTKKLDVTITQKDDELNTQTITDLNFITPNATDVRRIGMINTRSTTSYIGVTGPTSVGNGSNADLSTFLDNLKIYEKVRSHGHANVTIKYQDTEGNTIQADRIAESQEVGMAYNLLESDLTSIIANGFYYSFNPVATGAVAAMVESTGATIIVRFNKAPLTAGPYNWTGFMSNRWNEQDTNFSTDGVNQLGYQVGNTVIFNDAFAPIKTVELDRRMEMGDGNVVFNAPGYTLNSTTGFLNGNGSVILNASARLGFINNLAGPVVVNKDTLTLANTQSARRIEIKNGATLRTTVGISTPIQGDGGAFTFIPGVVSYTSAISNVSQVNYVMQVRGNFIPQSGIPRMNNTHNPSAKINVSTIAGDSTLFDTWADYSNNSIHLGSNVYMIHSESPLANGTTVRHIGELTGDAGSALVGNRVRVMAYHVGGLNTDATFHGRFIPFVRDAWDALTFYNLVKVGTGTWTLAGNSPDFFGSIRVMDGTLRVDGILCDMKGSYVFPASTVAKIIPEVFVAPTATLAGSGFIGANTVNVQGTITGNLTIGGTLMLTPDLGAGGATTIINVDGDKIDKIKVDGDLNYGGKLIVKVQKVPVPGSYRIFEFANFVESGLFGFDSIELPSANWSFNYTTGMLTYAGGDDTSVRPIDFNRPIESIEYYDLTGRKVTREFDGIVFKRVKFTDGTTAVQKMLIKK